MLVIDLGFLYLQLIDMVFIEGVYGKMGNIDDLVNLGEKERWILVVI